MIYLDYLPDTPYADLPSAAQAEISASEYGQLQVLGSGLAERTGLPNALGLALAAKVPSNSPIPDASSAVAKTSGVHAGWRLAALLSSVSLLGFILYSAFAPAINAGLLASLGNKTQITSISETPTPQTIERVVIRRDTVERVVRDTVTLFRTKVEIRVVRDTVYLRRNVPIAATLQLDSDESRDASKSLSSGLNWSELTVRGDGGFGGRE